MTAPMVIIELLLMREMYEHKLVNTIILVASAVVLAGCFGLIRVQAAINDEQFLKSMIPYHAGAILMCTEAPVQEAAVKTLCRKVIASQQSEIDEMKRILSNR